MKIDLNRLSQLAGIKNSGGRLNESTAYEGSAIDGLEEEEAYEGSAIDGLEEVMDEEEDAGLDEIIEIDEVMLVQELRRAKSLMESRKKRSLLESKKNKAKKEALYEAQLKRVIDAEVKAVLKELQDGQWVYGDNKPTRSKKGYTHQGSFLKGMGFK